MKLDNSSGSLRWMKVFFVTTLGVTWVYVLSQTMLSPLPAPDETWITDLMIKNSISLECSIYDGLKYGRLGLFNCIYSEATLNLGSLASIYLFHLFLFLIFIGGFFAIFYDELVNNPRDSFFLMALVFVSPSVYYNFATIRTLESELCVLNLVLLYSLRKQMFKNSTLKIVAGIIFISFLIMLKEIYVIFFAGVVCSLVFTYLIKFDKKSFPDDRPHFLIFSVGIVFFLIYYIYVFFQPGFGSHSYIARPDFVVFQNSLLNLLRFFLSEPLFIAPIFLVLYNFRHAWDLMTKKRLEFSLLSGSFGVLLFLVAFNKFTPYYLGAFAIFLIPFLISLLRNSSEFRYFNILTGISITAYFILYSLPTIVNQSGYYSSQKLLFSLVPEIFDGIPDGSVVGGLAPRGVLDGNSASLSHGLTSEIDIRIGVFDPTLLPVVATNNFESGTGDSSNIVLKEMFVKVNSLSDFDFLICSNFDTPSWQMALSCDVDGFEIVEKLDVDQLYIPSLADMIRLRNINLIQRHSLVLLRSRG